MRRILPVTLSLLLLGVLAFWVNRAYSYPILPTYKWYASYRFNTLKHPTGLAYVVYGLKGYNANPNLLISDTHNNVIRAFDINHGTLSIFAGNGTRLSGTPLKVSDSRPS